jgi:O-acetylserine/cysteine efflux transporter
VADSSLASLHPTRAMPTPTSLAAILVLALIWGLSIPLTKLGLVDLPPLTLTALRFASALPVLFLLAARQRLPIQAAPRVAMLGVIGIGIGQVAQTLGIEGTSASIGAILSATIPVFVVVFAAWRLKQTVVPRQALGVGLAFAGIAIVALGSGGEAGATSPAGVGWMILSSIAIAFYYVWSVELTRDHGTPAVAAWSTLAGFVVLAPWALWEVSATPARFTPTALVVAVYLGVFVTAIGLFLWLWLPRTVTAVVATSVQYLHPVIGILVAAASFGDALGLGFAAGVACILGGLALVVAPVRRS